jgi:hypothetical protein
MVYIKLEKVYFPVPFDFWNILYDDSCGSVSVDDLYNHKLAYTSSTGAL